MAVLGSTLMSRGQKENKEPGTIVTDRPDATETSTLVPKCFLQVETGGLHESRDNNDVKRERMVYNTTLLRYGLLDNMELRVGRNAKTRQTTEADFRFAFSHMPSDKSNLFYNVAAQWGNDSPELAYIHTLAFGHSITKKFEFYDELCVDFPENTTAHHFFDMGIRYLLQPNIQLDGTVGKDIIDDQDISLSTDISFRVSN